MDDANADVLYRETQRVRQPWLWGLLGIAFVSALRRRQSETGLRARLGPLFVVAAGALLASTRMTTEVREDGLYVRLAPLHRSTRRVPVDAIAGYETTTYRPLREFGGWGIRWRPGTLAYTVRGNRGVRVRRTGDRDVLVGSSRPEELVAALDRAGAGE